MDRLIFVGFIGQPSVQFQDRNILEEGFECWNLSNMSEKEFFRKIKKVIPPSHSNYEPDFQWSFPKASPVTPSSFQHASWGILLPLKDLGDETHRMIPEVSLLINLYCSTFVDPDFYVDSSGLEVLNRTPTLRSWEAEVQELSSNKFKEFYELLSPITKYHVWKDDGARRWSTHHWQIHFVSRMFIDEIKGYNDKGRSILNWQREIADLMTIAECLLTSESSLLKNKKIIERSGLILQEFVPDIEKEIKDFYEERSHFVHGATFQKFQRKIKENPSLNTHLSLLPNFELLDRYRKYTRLLIIACFYLRLKVPMDNSLKPLWECHLGNLIKHCIKNSETKKKIIRYVQEILACLPDNQLNSLSASN